MDEHSSLSSSLTDLMTSLMVIFILLLTIYLRNAQGEITEARSKTDQMRDILNMQFQIFDIEGVEVRKLDHYNLVVVVPEDKLQFESGQNRLDASAHVFLSRFTPALFDAFLKFQDDVSLINVEGHADKKLRLVAGNQYFNWDLSQARASAVMRYMFDYNQRTDAVERFKSIALFGGRGDIECGHSADADEVLRKTCRTVKFKIRMKSSEEAEQIRNELRPNVVPES